MPVLVGTSGWQYKHWRGSFYPAGVAQSVWLEFYARRFATVESNAAFYRLPEQRTFGAWQARTPVDFVMAVKASRYLTHIRRLRDPEEPVRRLLEHARGLGAKLGPVLLQLPPTLQADAAALATAMAQFPPTVRLAVEFRHPSWYTDLIRDLLTERGAALCLADSPRRSTPVWRTADWTYLRLHEGEATPRPCYDEVDLERWAARLADGWGPEADVFVYFNNDPRACALRDAVRFAAAAAARGLRPTRVPDPGEITVDAGNA